MILPTLTLAVILSIKTRRQFEYFLPNIAIALWIGANSIWMCDEFFELGIKNACYPLFALGLILILYWLVKYFPAIWRKENTETNS